MGAWMLAILAWIVVWMLALMAVGMFAWIVVLMQYVMPDGWMIAMVFIIGWLVYIWKEWRRGNFAAEAGTADKVGKETVMPVGKVGKAVARLRRLIWLVTIGDEVVIVGWVMILAVLMAMLVMVGHAVIMLVARW